MQEKVRTIAKQRCQVYLERSLACFGAYTYPFNRPESNDESANSMNSVPESQSAATSIAPEEIAKFSAMAAEWWDPQGKFRPLHQLNPVRLSFIRNQICSHFDRNEDAGDPLSGLDLLDMGCGGGLLSEPMCRLGANVTGADAAEKNIKTASVHAQEQGLDINYQVTTAEDLLAGGAEFDVVLAMEIIEHVASVPDFLATCADLLKPGGVLFVATLNRTLRAYGLAIVAAERILRWLPQGTHEWDKFVKPEEIEAALDASGLKCAAPTGVSFNPISAEWRLTSDTGVNYMMTATKNG